MAVFASAPASTKHAGAASDSIKDSGYLHDSKKAKKPKCLKHLKIKVIREVKESGTGLH